MSDETPVRLTPERLDWIRRNRRGIIVNGVADEILAHIDALTAEVAALDRDYGELLKSMTAELQEARAERDKANSLYQTTLALLEAVTREKSEPSR